MRKNFIRPFLIILAFLLLLAGCTQRQYTKVGINDEDDYSAAEYHVETITKPAINTNGITVHFVADTEYQRFFQVNGSDMISIYPSGVNMGLTQATTDLANPNVSYTTYMEWFKLISQMNANTVRVFTEMPPQFYQALLDYNTEADKPLYLIHGIWFNEAFMSDPGDCWDKDNLVLSSFENAIKEIVDIVHGNCSGIVYGDNQNAEFRFDVSKWLVGYILGLEWNNQFIENSNFHTDKSSFSGDYLKTADGATPFEAFLAMAGNTLISYETENYSYQAPVSFLNWVTNDTLTHNNEPFEEEDYISVDTENVLSTPKYYAGLFAAVDIYPYYPHSINYQQEYVDYRDDLTGKQNNYKAYLLDLKEEYSVPIIVAEFGVPTSRGCASESAIGYNQGAVTEHQQGQYVSNMIVDIASSGYAGGLIFSWQDEWFKQTWNCYRYYPENPLQRTPDKMSAEQNYGILAMEAGNKDICYVDGIAAEWSEDDIVSSTDNCILSAKYDESYLYVYVKLKNNLSFDSSKIIIPVSTIGIGSNKSNEYSVSFNKNADSIIVIDGMNNSFVCSDAYYDYFYYRYGKELGYVEVPHNIGTENSGDYGIVKQFVTGELVLPETNKTIQPCIYDIGKLYFGISDPNSDSFNSLSDFYADGDTVEIRIPWILLNVVNITEGVAFNNFNSQGEIATVKFDDIYIGADVVASASNNNIELNSIGFSPSLSSSYHTRLKKSYSYIQETLDMLYAEN